MKRRDFIKVVGVAAVAGTGVTSLSLAGIKNEEHIPWTEIHRVIQKYGFTTEGFKHKPEIAHPIAGLTVNLDDVKIEERIYYKDGSQHIVGFERINNRTGDNKLTCMSLTFLTKVGIGWELFPICSFYLDPQNWEAELREAISVGLRKKQNLRNINNLS
jgi:hypothetical protein